jgi:hypothetical protein
VLPKVHGEARWKAMREAAEFFNRLKAAKIPRKALENPIPHRYATELIGPYTQLIQPWQFGHGETKGICLWLHRLPPLMYTRIVTGREHRIHKTPAGKNQAKKRSVFFQGVAAAMADQWGSLEKYAEVS